MIPMSFSTSTSLGSTAPGSLNGGMANRNAMGMGIGQNWQHAPINSFANSIWNNWQITPQVSIQTELNTGFGGLSLHNNDNNCKCPICQGPTWAMGRVCDHCKTNVSRLRQLPLYMFGLDISDICMLKTQLNELEREEEKMRLFNLPDSMPRKGFVVKGFVG